jgi:glycosyltransferase involved in cell wall biosynthesis
VNVSNRRRSTVRGAIEREQLAAIEAHERRHYPQVGAVVVVTARDAETVRSIAPAARVEVVPNGVNPGPPRQPQDGQPILGFHGVFDSQANVDAARNLATVILPAVRRQVPGASVLLVGRRPPREVTALAGDGVRVVADAAEIRPLLDQLAVHVDWMTSGTGIKNKVLEAMAAGRPVVSSSLGAEGIDEGPGLVVAADVAEAVDAIVSLLVNPTTAAETGAAGRARVVADFSWAINADRLEALWRDVAGATP